MAQSDIVITSVSGKADLKAFVELPWSIYADDPNWVAPLKSDAYELVKPGKNPFFEHAQAQYFLARRYGKITGRISAHIDELALAMPPEQGMGPGTGNWGLFEAADAVTAATLIETAENWLRTKGMNRVLAPISLSIWEEPGLLIKGHDHPPTVLMGHHRPEYEAWIEGANYHPVKRLDTFLVPIVNGFPPIVQRIVESGERNSRIRIRRIDKKRFEEEAHLILSILNDAWGTNWGFVPITPTEVAFTGKKLKPLIHEDLIRIAEVDGTPVAFMMTWPDLNEPLLPMRGKLLPFNWIKLLFWLRRPRSAKTRVPLMGVVKRLQSSRLASQLAFMMIEYIRRDAIANFDAREGAIGWILEDNQGMVAIVEAIKGKVNKSYQVYAKPLS